MCEQQARYALIALLVLALGGCGGGGGTSNSIPIPASVPGSPVIRWYAEYFNHGQDVYELQIIRDRDSASRPVRVIADIAQWNAGSANLSNLYGTATSTPVTYHVWSGATTVPVTATWTVPPEKFGVTHHYQLRVLLKERTGTDGQDRPVYTFRLADFGDTITATSFEAVTAARITMPLSGSMLPVSQVRKGDANLRWRASVGADQYRVVLDPAQPGTGPHWVSSIIFSGSELPDSDRLSLASALDEPRFVGITMKWHVDARHGDDTNSAWTPGETVTFRAGP